MERFNEHQLHEGIRGNLRLCCTCNVAAVLARYLLKPPVFHYCGHNLGYQACPMLPGHISNRRASSKIRCRTCLLAAFLAAPKSRVAGVRQA